MKIFSIEFLIFLFNIIISNTYNSMNHNLSTNYKSCAGTGPNDYFFNYNGMSCADMIHCCPSDYYCVLGHCFPRDKSKLKRRNKTSSHNHSSQQYRNEKIEINNKKKQKQKKIEARKIEAERIEPIKIEKEEAKKPLFKGPVKINWKTFNQCLIDSNSEEEVIKEIIKDYKKKKESDAMKKVFTELKKNSPTIINCLNKQEKLT